MASTTKTAQPAVPVVSQNRRNRRRDDNRAAAAVITVLPFLVIAAHTIASPYTKVEESFTLHAVKDVIAHGIGREAVKHYDHISHPGPLPRSFIPPLIIAACSTPFLTLLDVTVGKRRNPLVDQVVVRLVLGFLNAASLSHLSITIRRTFGPTQAMFFVLLSVTQFHACYWAGRTVPNMLALSAATLALSLLLQSLRPSATSSESIRKRQEKKFTYAITLLAATASIIRAEVALLLFGILALVFYKESTSPSDAGINPDGNKNTRMLAGKHRLTVLAVRTTIVAGITSTAISIAVDSYFWSAWLAGRRHQQQQRVSLDSNGQGPGALQSLLKMVGFAMHWIWPEAWGLLFNVVEGKSSMWGTSPWYAYLFLHLPKLLLASLPLVVGPPLVNLRVRSAIKGWKALLLFPPAVLILGMSMLGHKEWRFIIYVVPWFNTLAALIAAQIWNGRHAHRQTVISRFLLLALIGGLIGNTMVTSGLAYISHHNYPGGMAMESLHRIHQARLDGVEADRRAANGTVRVFLPPSPRMTGASAYTFRHAPPFGSWEYNTTESLSTDFGTPEQLWRDGFDYVVTSMNEVEPFVAPSVKAKAEWVLLDSVNAFGGVERQKGLVPLGVRWKREIGILGRN